jgi:hypothetical protein
METAPEETLHLPGGGGTAAIYRNVKVNGVPAGDRMIVKYVIGNEDDVVVFKGRDKPTMRRVATQMGIQMPSSPTSSSSFSSGPSFTELPADEEKRLLAIYNRFGKP